MQKPIVGNRFVLSNLACNLFRGKANISKLALESNNLHSGDTQRESWKSFRQTLQYASHCKQRHLVTEFGHF